MSDPAGWDAYKNAARNKQLEVVDPARAAIAAANGKKKVRVKDMINTPANATGILAYTPAAKPVIKTVMDEDYSDDDEESEVNKRAATAKRLAEEAATRNTASVHSDGRGRGHGHRSGGHGAHGAGSGVTGDVDSELESVDAASRSPARHSRGKAGKAKSPERKSAGHDHDGSPGTDGYREVAVHKPATRPQTASACCVLHPTTRGDARVELCFAIRPWSGACQQNAIMMALMLQVWRGCVFCLPIL